MDRTRAAVKAAALRMVEKVKINLTISYPKFPRISFDSQVNSSTWQFSLTV
jgi:hypothetical protein